MRIHHSLITAGVVLALPWISRAEVRVVAEHSTEGGTFKFKSVPPPAINDAATAAHFTIVQGNRDPNGADLAALHDGRVPNAEDEPSANFFFRAGTQGGRIEVDLGKPISIKEVNTYSWHTGTRAPQVYALYAADASVTEPKVVSGQSPETTGWKRIAKVDTRPADGEAGGQYGVSIADPSKSLGEFRFLLFDFAPTEDRDPFGNTFYSEIDVIDSKGPAPTPFAVKENQPIVKSFEAEGGKFQFSIDATAAPDLAAWAETELEPVIQQWYPKLVALLPSDGFEAPSHVSFRFSNDLGGTPAATGGTRISLNAGWFRRELKREAKGAVVHEMVHVVQSYGRARRTNPNATRTPGWLVEGIADYVRWFLYEPQTKGAEITSRNLARARYNASYRVTGNFLNWVSEKYDKEIVRKLNAAAREGKYSEALWKENTGHSVEELGEEWLKANQARLEHASADLPKPTAAADLRAG